jgi:hypothetical protein
MSIIQSELRHPRLLAPVGGKGVLYPRHMLAFPSSRRGQEHFNAQLLVNNAGSGDAKTVQAEQLVSVFPVDFFQDCLV